MGDTESIGRRVATARKLRGWNQSELASKSGYSLSMIKKIERGDRAVDRYSTLHTFARVLGVEVGELTGESLRSKRAHAGAHQAVPAIRQALMAWPYGDLADGPVRPAAELHRAVARTIRGRQAGRFTRFGEEVPPLLEELRRGADGPEAEQINADLAELLHGTSMLLRRLSEVDLAWIAVQQARPAAVASADPLLVIANDWHLVELHYRAGDGGRAMRMADEALRRLEPWLTDPTPQALSLAGTLHLTRSIGAAQMLDRTGVDDALAEAAAAVAKVEPAGRDDYQTLFGKPNLAAITLASAVEIGDTARVVDLVEAFDPASIPTKERRARYLIDVARGYAQDTRDEAALRMLIEADKLAPEYVRHHVMARELVAQMVERSRALPDGLRRLAQRMSLT